MCIYGCNGLVEACLQIHKRNYAYEGAEGFLEAFDLWTEKNYGGAYDWPSTVEFTDEENNEIKSLSNDLNTYFQENYITFLDGSRPMSQWDAFVQGLNDYGFADYVAIYQAAYDRYLAE
jgi:hypothetical protein